MDTEDDPGPAVGLTGARFGGAPRRRRSARKRAEEAARMQPRDQQDQQPRDQETANQDAGPDAVTQVLPIVAGSIVAAPSGAGAEDLPPAEPGSPGPAPDADDAAAAGPVVGYTGARFGGASRRRREVAAPVEPSPTEPPALMSEVPAAPPVPSAGPTQAQAPEDVEPETTGAGSAFVRPYVFTGGRTRSSFELSIETLVSAVGRETPTGLAGEHDIVLDLCREPRSVAELAARAGVPLGVARVLVGDLAAAGAVAVHRSAGAAGPDLALMRRVLSGLRRL